VYPHVNDILVYFEHGFFQIYKPVYNVKLFCLNFVPCFVELLMFLTPSLSLYVD